MEGGSGGCGSGGGGSGGGGGGGGSIYPSASSEPLVSKKEAHPFPTCAVL